MAEVDNSVVTLEASKANEQPIPDVPIAITKPDKGMVFASVDAMRLFKKGAWLKAVRIMDPEDMRVGVILHFTKDESDKVTKFIRDLMRARFVDLDESKAGDVTA